MAEFGKLAWDTIKEMVKESIQGPIWFFLSFVGIERPELKDKEDDD